MINLDISTCYTMTDKEIHLFCNAYKKKYSLNTCYPLIFPNNIKIICDDESVDITKIMYEFLRVKIVQIISTFDPKNGKHLIRCIT